MDTYGSAALLIVRAQGGKARRARLARGKRSRIMSDELRSALALSRAREQIHKAHLKEVQGENKRLKEQLKEEKILYQQTLKKLHGLQQAGTRNRSPKNSRRASTGGGRMLWKGPWLAGHHPGGRV